MKALLPKEFADRLETHLTSDRREYPLQNVLRKSAVY